MNGRASTVREAVAAQVLGEVDDLVLRLENVARTIQGQESSHEASAAALLDATLAEETKTDKLLTQLGGPANSAAVAQAKAA